MSKLIVALFAGAFAFGSVSARADDVDRNPSEGKAAEKGAPAPKKDWPTRREKQEATAAAARERGTGAKEQPLTGGLGAAGGAGPRPVQGGTEAGTEAEGEEARAKRHAARTEACTLRATIAMGAG